MSVRERFDRLLEEWVPEEELREAWREYIHHRVPEPSGPPAIEPLVFQGRTEAGSLVEIRGSGDEFQVWVDGSLQERIAGEKDLSVDRPVLHFRWDGHEIEETFSASSEALRPWEYASTLLADGLIDVHFDLTPRSRRALARVEAAAP